jgi:pyruvate/2-oxoglutarate dehydrogenase complex dihydrolipoamide acyltransferase (E2) component
MAKSSKKSKEVAAQEGKSAAPGMESSNGLGTAEPAEPTVAKKAAAKSAGRAKSPGKNRSVTTRKTSAGRKTLAKAAQQSTAAGDAAVTDEEIRIRAYLISEWRMQNGVAGDSAHDWLEARRQLQEEFGKRG